MEILFYTIISAMTLIALIALYFIVRNFNLHSDEFIEYKNTVIYKDNEKQKHKI